MIRTQLSGTARFVAAVLGVVMLAGCSASIAGSASPAPAGGAGSAPSASVPAPAGGAGAPVDSTPFPPATLSEGERADVEIVDSGFTAYDVEFTGKVISYAIRLRNPNASSWIATSVRMHVTFDDPSGTTVYDDDLVIIYHVPPKATSAAGGTAVGGDLSELATSPTVMNVEITDISWFSTDDVTPGAITMGPATVKPGPPDTVDSVIVSCAARSTYASKVGSFSVNFVFLDAAGKIIGGNADNTTIDNEFLSIPGEAVSPLEFEELFSLPDGVPAAECYPSFVTPT